MRLGRICAALAVVGSMITVGTAVSAEGSAGSGAGRPERDLAGVREALAERAVASASRQDAFDVTPALRETPDTLDQIVDRVFDVSDGRGDITAASVLADTVTQIVATQVVRTYADPTSDPSWVVEDSGAIWVFDRNLDAVEDYFVVALTVNGALRAGVFSSANNALLCDATPFADPVTSSYAVAFEPDCIGLPLSGGGSFLWGATMGYDIGATIQFDDAPDTTWAGPVVDQVDPPIDPGSLNTLVPKRLLDTRLDGNTIDGQFRGLGRQSAGTFREVRIAGRGGVPADATAVLLNVTAVLPDAAGFLTVYPCDIAKPTSSNVNYLAGQVVPNAVLAKLSATGSVCVYTLATTDILVDVNGFVPTGATPVPVAPRRYLDTRSAVAGGTFDGLYVAGGKSPAGSVTEVLVAGRGDVPADATAVMINLTAVQPDAPGFLTVFACGSPQPLASHVNYQALQVAPNAVLAPVGAGGKVCIATLATTDLIVDVNGYVPAGGTLRPLVPARVLDTRPGATTVDGRFAGIGQGRADQFLTLDIAGRGGVPLGAKSVMLNVTAVVPGGDGFLTVWPCDADRPLASNVNYRAGQVTPNAVLAKLSASGTVCIYTLAATDVLVDVSGYVG